MQKNRRFTTKVIVYAAVFAALAAVLGQLLAGLGLWYCVRTGVSQVSGMMPYLSALTLAILSVVHLTASMTAGVWTVRALEKQIFPTAGRFVDLQMDEEVEA